MKKLAIAVTAAAGLALALPATAHADSQNFQSPSGNIFCILGAEGAACDIEDYTFTPPPPPECGQHIKWGNRFTLAPGKPGTIECHGDTLQVPGEQTLDYGHSISAGTISCRSEQAGMRCTDSRSAHYFFVSRDSYSVG